MTPLLLVLSALTIIIITASYPQSAGPLIMPLGASAAVVNASIMLEKSMCGFFHNRCAKVSERASGVSGKGQNCSLLLVIGKPETESLSDGASLLKTESNGPILPSAVINWYETKRGINKACPDR
jgi:hypothetical protein